MTEYKFHELCLLFPPCTNDELMALRNDIEKNGQIEPAVLYEGKILDGRNRATACAMLGIELETVEYEGDDPVAFVMSKNLCRRHLNESQRAMIAAKLANLPPHRPVEKDKAVNLPTYSQEQAAESLNVSESQVRKAKKLQRVASQEVIEQVELGKKTVHAALRETKESKEQPKKEISVLSVHVDEMEKTAEKLLKHYYNVIGQMFDVTTIDDYRNRLARLELKNCDLYDKAEARWRK
jgi:hypothetical protein